MKKFILTLIFCTVLSTLAQAHNEVYFTPSDKCENKLVDLIDNTQSSIDAAVYAITNTQITEALKRAQTRGVKIRILTDRLQASNRYSKVMEIHNFGIDIKINSKHKIEHNKFAVFDGKVISTGSYNWTEAASNKNSENCLFLTEEPEITTEYTQAFNRLWILNKPEKSTRWFALRKKNYKLSAL